eukprot:c4810_g1_i1.p1 GENE.c4810_g1_i1~~c4810_g1_i1.p1  ORF type:complete len:273 (-),score=56.12 c4810_g1_i1:435-1214(-)
MSFLFKPQKSKSFDLVRVCAENLQSIDSDDSKHQKLSEEVGKAMASIKLAIYGDPEHEANPELAAVLSQSMADSQFIVFLVHKLGYLSFETRKDAALVFKHFVQRQIDVSRPGVDYILQNPEIVSALVKNYNNPDTALISGSMLRECLKHESLTKLLLSMNLYFSFFDYVEHPNFDVASDAFMTFRETLTKHKTVCAEFLDQNYSRVFELYTKLLTSENYVTRRQSLKKRCHISEHSSHIHLISSHSSAKITSETDHMT